MAIERERNPNISHGDKQMAAFVTEIDRIYCVSGERDEEGGFSLNVCRKSFCVLHAPLRRCVVSLIEP